MKTIDSASSPLAISVVIPTRNRPAFLRQAVSSVLGQSQPAWRIVIVDDGSWPEYRREIGLVAGMHTSISLFAFKASRGVGAARNAGLAEADGDFVLFLDDDDLLDARFVEESGGFLAAHPESDVVVCRSRIFLTMPKGAPLPKWFWLTDQFNGRRLQEKPFREILRFPVPINGVLFRRSCLEEAPFRTDLRVGEERFLLLSLAARGCRFAFNPLLLSLVRIHPENAQAAPDMAGESVRFLKAVLSGGFPLGGHDRFLCHARMLQASLWRGGPDFWPSLWMMFRMPHLSMFYSAWHAVLQIRKRIRYHALAAEKQPVKTGVPL